MSYKLLMKIRESLGNLKLTSIGIGVQLNIIAPIIMQ